MLAALVALKGITVLKSGKSTPNGFVRGPKAVYGRCSFFSILQFGTIPSLVKRICVKIWLWVMPPLKYRSVLIDFLGL